MKINSNINLWKTATLFFAATSFSMVVLTAFNYAESPAPKTPMPNSTPVIENRDEAKALYAHFLKSYPLKTFKQRGGFIAKSTLEEMLRKMVDPKDDKLYYYFGTNTANENLIMLFNDPAFNDVNTTPQYKTIAPFCPTACNEALNNYLTN